MELVPTLSYKAHHGACSNSFIQGTSWSLFQLFHPQRVGSTSLLSNLYFMFCRCSGPFDSSCSIKHYLLTYPIHTNLLNSIHIPWDHVVAGVHGTVHPSTPSILSLRSSRGDLTSGCTRFHEFETPFTVFLVQFDSILQLTVYWMFDLEVRLIVED